MSMHYFNNQKKTNIIKKKIIHVALKKQNNQKSHPRHRKDKADGLLWRHPPAFTVNDFGPFRAGKYQECLEKV